MSDTEEHTPRFSVLIAAYNAAATIQETLQSLVAQTEPDWQACIVDDGSSDGTFAIAAEFAARDGRFVVHRQVNQGTAAARNTAARAAAGEWVCILDADDMYRPGYLERMGRFISEHPGFDIYSCNADALRLDGSTHPYGPERYPQEVRSLTLAETIELNRIFSAAVVRAEAFRRADGFRAGVYVEDYDLWLRLMAGGSRHLHNPESLVLYRILRVRKTSNVDARLASLLEVYGHLRSVGVDADEARVLDRRIAETERDLHRVRATAAWDGLRPRLLRGEYAGARRAYWAARGGPMPQGRYIAGLMLVSVSPRLLAATLRRGKAKRR